MVVSLIAFHLVVHQDEGGWVAKVNWQDTTTLDGHLVEWEWQHVDETVAIVDADGGTAPRVVHSQNLYRFVGGYLLALLREPLGGYYAGAVAAHVAAWVAAAWALFVLGTLSSGSPRGGVLAAAFTATGPGFIGYLGQVDAHPFGYAAVAVYPAAVERLGVFAAPRGGAVVWLRPVCAGLALFVAAYTMEVGYPLLLFLWLFYLPDALRRRSDLRLRVAQLGLLTVAFLGPYLGFQLLTRGILFEDVQTFNDAETYLRRALTSLAQDGPQAWLVERAASVVVRWWGDFPPLVSALALLGAWFLPRRWLRWSVTFLLAFCTAVALTKPATRELYLAFPAVYVLAAGGTEHLGARLAGLCTPAADLARRAWLQRLLLATVVLAVIGVTNADLWGSYDLPARWYQCRIVTC
jgi:hypothetical protein